MRFVCRINELCCNANTVTRLAYTSFKNALDLESVSAYVLFTYAFSADPRSGGEQVNDAGRIINILEHQNDGSWKIRYHLSNSTWNLQETAIE